jgi:type VI secretion system FHA domain protein
MLKLRIAMTGSEDTILSEHVVAKDAVAIGRIMGNDVVLPDVEKRVSSKHARLERNAGGWRLIDLGSTNGTFLNDRRMDAQAPAPLKNGDRISIGLFQLRVVLEEAVEGRDQTAVAIDVPRAAASLAADLPALWARMAGETPEARQEAVRATLRKAVASLPPETARTVLSQVQARFKPGDEARVMERGTLVRRRDAEIQKREELYHGGQRALATLSQHLLGDDGFESPEQMELFSTLLRQTLELTLDWLSKSLKGRKEFEDQFSADLTMVFGRQANPLKSAGTGSEMAKFLLDWHSPRSPQSVRAALDDAFKDLTMHQIGLLAGVQESLSAVLRRLDPKAVEAEVKAKGGLFSSLAKKAWDRYAEIYAEIFAENSRLFNEMIYPNVRKGYLATHSDPQDAGGASATPKLEGPKL